MNDLINKINNFSIKNELFSKDDSVIISASAGKDSITLIEYFLNIKEEFNLNIAAVSNVGQIVDGPWKNWDCIGNDNFLYSAIVFYIFQSLPFGKYF